MDDKKRGKERETMPSEKGGSRYLTQESIDIIDELDKTTGGLFNKTIIMEMCIKFGKDKFLAHAEKFRKGE